MKPCRNCPETGSPAESNPTQRTYFVATESEKVELANKREAVAAAKRLVKHGAAAALAWLQQPDPNERSNARKLAVLEQERAKLFKYMPPDNQLLYHVFAERYRERGAEGLDDFGWLYDTCRAMKVPTEAVSKVTAVVRRIEPVNSRAVKYLFIAYKEGSTYREESDPGRIRKLGMQFGIGPESRASAAENPSSDEKQDFLEYVSNRPMLPEHVKARLIHDDKPTVLEWYSLCTDDCEHGFHVPVFKKCDRCGAQIHKTIVEVYDPERGEIIVGSECIKDVMGWKWAKSHENALAIQNVLDRVLREVGTPIAILRKYEAGKMIIQTAESDHPYDAPREGGSEPSGEGWKMRRGRVIVTIPGGWTSNLLRAAADIGLPWRQVDKDDIEGDGRKRAWFHRMGGTGWIVAVRGTDLLNDMGVQGWRVRNYSKIIASGQLPSDAPGYEASRSAIDAGRVERENDHVEILTTVGPWVRYRADHNYWSGNTTNEFMGMNPPARGNPASQLSDRFRFYTSDPVVGSSKAAAVVVEPEPGEYMVKIGVGDQWLVEIGSMFGKGSKNLKSLAQAAYVIEQTIPHEQWDADGRTLLDHWAGRKGRALPHGWAEWDRFEQRKGFIQWAEPAPASPNESRYAVVNFDGSIRWCDVSPNPEEQPKLSGGAFYEDMHPDGAVAAAAASAMKAKAKTKAMLDEFDERVKSKRSASQATPSAPARETWPDGRLKPVVGDTVYQYARGIGGTKTTILGTVVISRGKPRVKITGSAGAGGVAPVGKTFPVDADWTVQDDPAVKAYAEKRAAEKKAQEASKDADLAAEDRAMRAEAKKRGWREAKPSDLAAGLTLYRIDSTDGGKKLEIHEEKVTELQVDGWYLAVSDGGVEISTNLEGEIPAWIPSKTAPRKAGTSRASGKLSKDWKLGSPPRIEPVTDEKLEWESSVGGSASGAVGGTFYDWLNALMDWRHEASEKFERRVRDLLNDEPKFNGFISNLVYEYKGGGLWDRADRNSKELLDLAAQLRKGVAGAKEHGVSQEVQNAIADDLEEMGLAVKEAEEMHDAEYERRVNRLENLIAQKRSSTGDR